MPGGHDNYAGGDFSFAAGHHAKIDEAHNGTFLWADSTDADFSSTGPDQFLIRAGGGVGIGTDSPRNQLDVVRNKSGSSANANHVMVVDNTATSQGNVLGLRTNATTPGATENFITFKAASSNVGAIEGDGSGGITLSSGSADFAEYLRVADGAADIQPADVVGVVGDTVSLQTAQADRAMVVSTRPIMTGNDPGLEAGDRDGHVPVAFLGQVPVRVSGPVNAGDYLVPSGLDDGTGIGIPPDELTANQLPQVVGRALEDARTESHALVKTLVGLPQAAITASVIERRDLRLDQLESRVTEQGQQLVRLHEVNAKLHHELDRLASRNAELRETVRSLVGTHEQSPKLKQRIAKLEAILLEQSELAKH
ncbi:hypothetical protein DZK25_07705 [Wenzhouxiangella sp. 15181]|nr:hypothetical protein DZK25_07705 [Wenzhouxiangella sp. 15181]